MAALSISFLLICHASLIKISRFIINSSKILGGLDGSFAMTAGAKKYFLKPEGISVGDTVMAGESADAKVGNAMPLKNVPDGFMVHNIEVLKWSYK